MGRVNQESTGPRLVSDLPLPPYTFVPGGRFPHPRSDPNGHSFGRPVDRPPPPDPQQWPSCRPYLHGIDLFNHGYYWEAHEVWEGLWNACGRKGTMAEFLKAMIKLAAAGVKVREGRVEGVVQHARRAGELFRKVAAEVAPTDGRYFGLSLAELADFGDAIARQPPALHEPGEVRVVFDRLLVPS